MSIIYTAKRLVPLPVRRHLGRIVDQLRRGRPARTLIPLTPLPLPSDFVSTLRKSIAHSRSLSSSPYAGPDFPDDEELKGYWGTVRAVTRILEPLNGKDKYFNMEKFHQQRIEGRFTISKDLFTAWLAVRHAPPVIFEIGCRTGKSICIHLLLHPRAEDATVILLDPFLEQGSPQKVITNIRAVGAPDKNTYFIAGYSEQAVPHMHSQLPELACDYILVDGSHKKEDALQDLRTITPMVRGGGYILFDDIGSYGPGIGYGLIDVWNEWKREVSDLFTFREYPESWGFAAARRKQP